MSRYNPGRLGDWVGFCDICGQKLYASEAIPLSTYTGRGGLIVCPRDADKVDFGLIPYKIPLEQNVPWARPGDYTVGDSSPIFDYESDTVEDIGNYIFLSDNAGNVLLTNLGEWLRIK